MNVSNSFANSRGGGQSICDTISMTEWHAGINGSVGNPEVLPTMKVVTHQNIQFTI